MKCKIRKNLNHGPRHEFYRNVAVYHLPMPRLRRAGFVDGYPIIHVDTGRAQ
ncbi:hypothetical protein [uncultured Methanobrevibacter sp.]|uniref:hypothetical protein n=1 Tax=uncultured Methanobrevibacter sp. TaxID=253161 RepID=UPI0026001B1B|nr:hypothetical protein [uncultured Methanobrevibacter sp.]